MIQAFEPMIFPDMSGEGNGDTQSVCVTFENGRKIVSLSLDNSCGRMETLRRGDILLMVKTTTKDGTPCNQDVTETVFEEAAEGHAVHASLGNFRTAMLWLDRAAWGMDGCAGKQS